MSKKAYFYIDDTIWMLRELARTKPASMFEVPYFKHLKEMHDTYGLKVQLNLFYRTSSFYGMDEFSLAEVPDTYKAEWEQNSDWLKCAFHAKEEFPDYPHVNATYDDMYKLFKMIEGEVIRFAGEKSFTYATCPHWLPVSKQGVKALYDCGVRVLDATKGYTEDYNGDPASLPYGHAARLLNNRQPETRVFRRGGRDVAIDRSVCGYNHFELDAEGAIDSNKNLKTIPDKETGMLFKIFCSACLNLIPLDEVEEEFKSIADNEYIGICNHEQYFYPDYFAYQPDQAEKYHKMCKVLVENGYEFFFMEDILK